ncbi:fatty acid-binding protein, muscle-like [Galleria mellonella]|uniref:Fatty acid-binding protein, muscle-like n=1 Tax=Galleria mellonella TaxID=7137 RepID=A0ABM3MKR9_GALME|nr:fatty acid-binding protein, muscle-like [Galleria mellonella]
MERFLDKKYKLKTSDCFEEYMKFLGIGFVSRMSAASVTPVITLSRNDNDSYSLTTQTSLKNTQITFKPGEEFVEERPDGVKVNSIITFDGNNLIHLQTDADKRTSTQVRSYTDTLMTAITTANGWSGKCVRTYEYIP